MQLRNVEMELRGDLFDQLGRFIDENAHFPDVRGDFVHPGFELRRRNAARTGAVKDEAESASARIDRSQRVFAIRDAADFNEHSGDQFPQGAHGVPRLHQMLAHQKGVVSRVHQAMDIARGENAALADLDDVGGDLCARDRPTCRARRGNVRRSRLFTPMISAPD